MKRLFKSMLIVVVAMMVQAAYAQQVCYQYTGPNFNYSITPPYTDQSRISATAILPANAFPISIPVFAGGTIPYGAGFMLSDTLNYAFFTFSSKLSRVTFSGPPNTYDPNGQSDQLVALSYMDPTVTNGASISHTFNALRYLDTTAFNGAASGSFWSVLANPSIYYDYPYWTSPPVPTCQITLVSGLSAIVNGMTLGMGSSLMSQLNAVQNDIVKQNGLACTDLNTFKQHVLDQTGHKITQLQSDRIIKGGVASISSALQCP